MYRTALAPLTLAAVIATTAATAQTTGQATAPAPGAPTQAAPTQTTQPATAATTPAGTAATAPNPTVGGAAMDATKPILVNAAAAPNLSTLVAAVKTAGLDATLSGPGPFTVFAPTNEAFGRLAPGTVDTLLKPENKPSLVKVLTYHVVPGTVTLEQLKAQIAAGGGKASLTTVEGQPLVVAAEGAAISLTDANGNKSYVQTPDVRQANGIVHVVNGVVVPKLG